MNVKDYLQFIILITIYFPHVCATGINFLYYFARDIAKYLWSYLTTVAIYQNCKTNLPWDKKTTSLLLYFLNCGYRQNLINLIIMFVNRRILFIVLNLFLFIAIAWKKKKNNTQLFRVILFIEFSIN